MERQTLILFIGMLLVGCIPFVNQGDSDFYSYTKDGDLWRVPLLEPYEAISPTNSDDWVVRLHSTGPLHPEYLDPGDDFQFTYLTEVGIMDSVIVLHNGNEYWPKLAGSYPSVLLIDVRHRDFFLFSTEHHQEALAAKLEELGIAGMNMHPFETVKNDFLQELKRPETW